MADSPNYPSCIAKNFVQDGKQYKGRVDLFLDKFYGEKKFLTEVGLVDVFFCIITIKRDTYEFDASFSEERSEFLAKNSDLSSLKEASNSYVSRLIVIIQKKTSTNPTSVRNFFSP